MAKCVSATIKMWEGCVVFVLIMRYFKEFQTTSASTLCMYATVGLGTRLMSKVVGGIYGY